MSDQAKPSDRAAVLVVSLTPDKPRSAMQEHQSQIAEAVDYDTLLAALNARAFALRLTREGIDALAEWAPGYAGKILAPVPVKGIGRHSLGRLLRTLALRIVLVEDPSALKEIVASGEQRRCAGGRKQSVRSTLRIAVKARRERMFGDPLYFKNIGGRGGAATAKQRSSQERSAAASKASRARWRKQRSRSSIARAAHRTRQARAASRRSSGGP